MDTVLKWAFFSCAVALSLCSIAAAKQPDSGKGTDNLRVMTYNIHGGGPVALTDAGKGALQRARKKQSVRQMLAEAMEQQQADIIALQEASSKKFVEQLATDMKMHYAYFPGGWQDPDKGWPEGIPTAILSRFPIIAQQNCPLAIAKERPKDLFTRGYGRVLVKVGDEELAVFVAHLLPSWKNTTHIREGEIKEISAAVKKDRAAGRSVIIMGDMNHSSKSPEYKGWAKGQMVDAFTVKGTGDPKTCSVKELKERIDYVFASGPIAKRIVDCHVLNKPPFDIDPKQEASFALSDHLPVVADFKKK